MKKILHKGEDIIMLFERISTLNKDLSSGQQRISEYIVKNYKKSAFMNSTELANEVGVSNPTIIRFAKALGYKGYHEFQVAMQNAVQNELSALERRAYLSIDSGADSCYDLYTLETENMQTIFAQLDKNNLNKAVSLLAEARTVYIFGKQISESMAVFAQYTLGKILDNVRLVNNWSLQDENALKDNQKKCCAIVIALPRYPVATIKFLRFLQERNVPAVVITGAKENFPFNKEKKFYILEAPLKYISFIDPISSIFFLINCLAISIIKRKGKGEIKPLTAFEKYVAANHIYVSSDDININQYSNPLRDGVENKKNKKQKGAGKYEERS